jgi:hypothetical protein
LEFHLVHLKAVVTELPKEKMMGLQKAHQTAELMVLQKAPTMV